MDHVPARDRVAVLFDRFDWDQSQPRSHDPLGFEGYREQIAAATSSSGEEESVVTGIGMVGELPVAAAVFDFGFLGGSMGEAAGARLEAAMNAAAARGIPFVAVISSGGARMQEGMAALAQMPRTVAGSAALATQGIPRIGLLCHPTTGGVYASFASLSDVLIAEAGATVGFAGPRVAETMSGKRLPEGSHTAEAAFAAGLVDAVVGRDDLKGTLAGLVRILSAREITPAPKREPRGSLPPADHDAWEKFRIVRHPGRPSPRRYLSVLFEDLFELRGDRMGGDDPAVIAALALFEGRTVVVAALDRASPSASGFRKAVRAIETAGRLRVPLITLVDTPGADPSFESEYSGLAAAIARTFEAILTVPSTVISIVTGEGGSGGALALACGDTVLIQEHAVFSVIAPEGAGEILYRDARRAPEVASRLRPTSADLIALGLADEIVSEPPSGAHADPGAAAELVRESLSAAISRTEADPTRRRERYSRLTPLSPTSTEEGS